jgi:hypothetical protein
MRWPGLSIAIVLVVSACSPAPGMPDAGLDAPRDAGTDANLMPWPHDRASIADQTRRGFHLARGIVHLHSPLSHDACDGQGWVDGGLADAECLAHLRDAACMLRMDFLFLTDHAPNVDTVALEDALWIAPGDEAIENAAGEVVAARWACPGSDHRALVMPGSENELMPVALERHPPGDAAARAAAYEADGPDAAAVLRAAGALVLYAHTEGHPLEQIRATAPDGIEIYNTHANIDPRIREELLGLPPLTFIGNLLAFTRPANALEPDLALLSFLSPNEVSLARWDTILAEGTRMVGTGGCDAHENALPQVLTDGERADGYRRMMGWHAHHFLVDGDDREATVEALARGRFSLVFEVLGTPVGFDFRAVAPGGAVSEMGDEAAVGATLHVDVPSIGIGFPSSPAPLLRARILRAAEGGAVELVASSTDTVEWVTTEPGAYRVEVRMTPEHARPYLGALADELVHEVVWIYSSPIYVR